LSFRDQNEQTFHRVEKPPAAFGPGPLHCDHLEPAM